MSSTDGTKIAQAFLVDPAELARHPDLVTVVIGTVVEVHEATRIMRQQDGIEYQDFVVDVEEYILWPHPTNQVIVRVIEKLLRREAAGEIITGIPSGEPGLNIGEHVLLFLSKKSYYDYFDLGENEFRIVGPLAGKFLIKDDLVRDASMESIQKQWPWVSLSETLESIREATK